MPAPAEPTEAAEAIAQAVARGDLVQQLGELVALLDRHATARGAAHVAAIKLSIFDSLARIAARYSKAQLIALRRRDDQVEWLLNAVLNRIAREDLFEDPRVRLLEAALLEAP